MLILFSSTPTSFDISKIPFLNMFPLFMSFFLMCLFLPPPASLLGSGVWDTYGCVWWEYPKEPFLPGPGKTPTGPVQQGGRTSWHCESHFSGLYMSYSFNQPWNRAGVNVVCVSMTETMNGFICGAELVMYSFMWLWSVHMRPERGSVCMNWFFYVRSSANQMKWQCSMLSWGHSAMLKWVLLKMIKLAVC